MSLDQITVLLGEFGSYQKQKYFLMCLFSTLSAFHALNMVFVGAEQKYQCNLPDLQFSLLSQQNISYQDQHDLFIPEGQQCRHYDLKERLVQLESVEYNVTAVLMTYENASKVPCTAGYNYSKEEYLSTITSDFNLVCENKYWRSTSRSVFFGGRLVGAVVFGQLSDRFGRRPMFLLGVLVLLIAGIVASLSPNMFVFLPMYFLQGAAHTGAFLVAFTLYINIDYSGVDRKEFIMIITRYHNIHPSRGMMTTVSDLFCFTSQVCEEVTVTSNSGNKFPAADGLHIVTAGHVSVGFLFPATELVGPNYRVVAGFVIQIFYGFGYLFLAGLAYFIREWRYLELAITLPAVLFGCYWWLLPESIPWLLSRGRDDEAAAILLKAAKQNGVILLPNVIRDMKEDSTLKGEKRQYFFLDCLRTWNMALLSLNVWFNWLVNSFVFYGISLNSENLSGNPYLNFCLIGGVGMIGSVFCLLVVNKTGRRLSLISSMCVGGVACIVASFLLNEKEPVMKILVKVFVLIGKFCITASYSIIYLMAAELFPTVVRNIGMGVASMSARIGGIFAPFVLELKDIWGPFPLLIFGALSILAGLLALFLPETSKKPLPQTLEDVKDRGHGLTCLKKSRKFELEANRVV